MSLLAKLLAMVLAAAAVSLKLPCISEKAADCASTYTNANEVSPLTPCANLDTYVSCLATTSCCSAQEDLGQMLAAYGTMCTGENAISNRCEGGTGTAGRQAACDFDTASGCTLTFNSAMEAFGDAEPSTATFCPNVGTWMKCLAASGCCASFKEQSDPIVAIAGTMCTGELAISNSCEDGTDRASQQAASQQAASQQATCNLETASGCMSTYNSAVNSAMEAFGGAEPPSETACPIVDTWMKCLATSGCCSSFKETWDPILADAGTKCTGDHAISNSCEDGTHTASQEAASQQAACNGCMSAMNSAMNSAMEAFGGAEPPSETTCPIVDTWMNCLATSGCCSSFKEQWDPILAGAGTRCTGELAISNSCEDGTDRASQQAASQQAASQQATCNLETASGCMSTYNSAVNSAMEAFGGAEPPSETACPIVDTWMKCLATSGCCSSFKEQWDPILAGAGTRCTGDHAISNSCEDGTHTASQEAASQQAACNGCMSAMNSAMNSAMEAFGGAEPPSETTCPIVDTWMNCLATSGCCSSFKEQWDPILAGAGTRCTGELAISNACADDAERAASPLSP